VSTDFWTKGREDIYGAWHVANPAAPTYRPDILFVFVHGIRADRMTWQDLPEALLAKLGIDADVLSYEFPANIWQKASIWTAAEELKTYLGNTGKTYPTWCSSATAPAGWSSSRCWSATSRTRSRNWKAVTRIWRSRTRSPSAPGWW